MFMIEYGLLRGKFSLGLIKIKLRSFKSSEHMNK